MVRHNSDNGLIISIEDRDKDEDDEKIMIIQNPLFIQRCIKLQNWGGFQMKTENLLTIVKNRI